MTTTQRIAHQLRTDLHRNWKLLLLLAIGLAAFASIDLLRHLKPPQRFNTELLTVAVFGFGCLMGLVIIHGDPATGSSPFWKTRPVRGWELFCSKAIQIFLVGLLMFAAWTAAPQLAGHESIMAWDFAKIILPLLFGIAAIAAVSRNLVQALLIGGALWIGVAAIAWIWNLTTHQLPIFGKTQAMRETGLFLAALALAAGALGVALYQYLRQRQFIAIAVFFTVLLGAFLVMQNNSADLVTRQLTPAQQAALGVEDATFVLDSNPDDFQRGSHTIHTPTKTFEYVQLSTDATLEELPEGIYATHSVIDGEMRNPQSGEFIPSVSQAYRSHGSNQLASSITGDFRILWQTRSPPARVTHQAHFLRIPREAYPSMSSQNWQYQGIANSRLAHLVPLPSVPFGEARAFRHRGWSASLSSKIDGSMTLRVDFQASTWRLRGRSEMPAYTILIVNPERKEALANRGGGLGGSGSNRRWHTQNQATFSRQIWQGDERIEIGEDWLADAEVVVYLEEFLGTIERPVTIERLTLPEVEFD